MDGLEEFHDPERISKRLAFHRNAIAEEQQAREICDAVLTGPSQWWGNALRGVEESRTAGMVTILIQRSYAALDHSPPDALALTELAVTIAGQLPPDRYPYDQLMKLRGDAMREQAFVLSYMGRLMEAARIADMAGVILVQAPIPLIELARLDLVRSNIARNMGKYDKAIAYAREAGETYRDFGNQRSWLMAIEYEAAAYYSAQNYKRALELWHSAGEHVEVLPQEQQAARLHNIGICASALGDFDEAARSFAAAGEVFERLGLVVNRVKCRHSLGLAMHEAGRHSDAVGVLEKAQEELDALGMESDAALAALTRVEALFAAGRPDEVPAICRMLIERFTRAGNNCAAMTALAYLRETVATGHATPASVRMVRDFIRDTTLRRAGSTPYAEPPLDDSTKRLDG
ncbi:MAG TPA: tetratricopeptide repeat protein [Vicinamibacterales bacterium]